MLYTIEVIEKDVADVTAVCSQLATAEEIFNTEVAAHPRELIANADIDSNGVVLRGYRDGVADNGDVVRTAGDLVY